MEQTEGVDHIMSISSSSPDIIAEEQMIMPHQEESSATFSSLEISSTRGNGNGSAPINSSSSPDIIVEEQEIMPHQEELPATFSSLEISSTRENGNGNAPINSSGNLRWHLGLQIMLIVVQVAAAVFVLLLSSSRHERPKNLLRESTILYATGCVAALPLVFWGDDNADQALQAADMLNYCIQRNIQFESFRYFFGEDNPQRTNHSESRSTRQVLMMGLRIILNVAFGFWLVTTCGRILIEGTSSAPILYLLNVVYFSYTCFVHVLGLTVTCTRVPQTLSGCSIETINSLPVHIFNTGGNNGGGVVAQDSDNERHISENEAVCAICLATYEDNDELRELPCSHLLHKECVDRWLRIQARCPLCRRRVPS